MKLSLSAGRKRRQPIACVAVLLLLDTSIASGGERGFVHQQGTEILDGTGRRIALRGVNLGGWLLWEGWIWGGEWDSETTLMERFREGAGDALATEFRDRVRNQFITEADVRRIAGMGFNVVRVPFHYRILEDDAKPYVYKASGWKLLDAVVSWGKRYGVYVVLDLHATPGAQNPLFISDAKGGAKLWRSPENQARTVALWRAIAKRYAASTTVAGYDLINEPAAKGKDLVSLYRRIITAIREVDRNHMVILEGGKHSTDFSMFDGPLSDNQAYSFHMYTWFGDNRKRELSSYKKLSQTHQVPIFCGEFGENRYAMIESTVELFEDPQYGIDGWIFWTWKKVRNRFPPLAGIQVDDAWRDWHKRPGLLKGRRKPLDRNEAQSLMNRFLEASAAERLSIDSRMKGILTAPLSAKPSSERKGGATGQR